MAKKGTVQFHIQHQPFTLRNRTALKDFLLKMSRREGRIIDHINYIFCADDYLLQVNQRYLNHDTYTDIISFPYSETNQPITGDIFISIDRVKENALKFQTSFNAELHRVIFHGLLHFLGYKDKTRKEKALMRVKEDFYLDLYF